MWESWSEKCQSVKYTPRSNFRTGNNFFWKFNLSVVSSGWLIKNISKNIIYERYLINSWIHFFSSFFFLSGFFSRTFAIHTTAGEGGGYLSPLYHFHSFHRHLDINRAIAAECSPLHIAFSRIKPGIFGFRAQVANH